MSECVCVLCVFHLRANCKNIQQQKEEEEEQLALEIRSWILE